MANMERDPHEEQEEVQPDANSDPMSKPQSGKEKKIIAPDPEKVAEADDKEPSTEEQAKRMM